jgi:hypothetical protein
MNIVPTRIEEQISRVDRNQALIYGILSGVSAFFMAWKLLWLIVGVLAWSTLSYSPFFTVLSFVSYGALLALSAWVSFVFMRRYVKQP